MLKMLSHFSGLVLISISLQDASMYLHAIAESSLDNLFQLYSKNPPYFSIFIRNIDDPFESEDILNKLEIEFGKRFQKKFIELVQIPNFKNPSENKIMLQYEGCTVQNEYLL